MPDHYGDPLTRPLSDSDLPTQRIDTDAEAKARWALGFGVPGGPDSLSPEVREAYERLKAAGETPPRPQAPGPPAYEKRMEKYARQTRTGVVAIAWIMVIFAALSVIGAVQILHAIHAITGVGP